jgi:hypothetical protein
MGTSASNNGPKGSPPLLPDWYDALIPLSNDNDQEQVVPPEGEDQLANALPPNDLIIPNEGQQQIEITTNWGTAKGALRRLSNNTKGASKQKAAKKYVGTLGGAKTATKAASQGIRVAGNYAGFLGSIASEGFTNTIRHLGLDQYLGRPTEEICAAIADALSPIGSTNDEAIARDALISTLDSLYSRVLEEGESLDTLNALTPELIKETLIEYVSNFIFSKWMYELGIAIEKGNISEQDAVELENEVRNLIFEETKEQYRENPIEDFNLNDEENIKKITEIFETAYSTLEI